MTGNPHLIDEWSRISYFIVIHIYINKDISYLTFFIGVDLSFVLRVKIHESQHTQEHYDHKWSRRRPSMPW